MAELVADSGRPAGWTLLVDGVEQSYVDASDPAYLKFYYVRWIAAVLDAAAPAGEPLRVLHLGGGAMTLPRYVALRRPGSAQVVVEHDAALVALVDQALPRPTEIVVWVEDARAAVSATAAATFDVVIGDVYAGAHMPRHLASVEFAGDVARVLVPGGRYVVNVTDLPVLAFSRIQAATVAAVFAEVAVIGDRGMLRGRRHGNLVLVGARDEGTLAVPRLVRALARDPIGPRILHGPDLTAFLGGVGPMHDA